MHPDKPFMTIDQQIDIISSRNVKIERDFFTYESLSSISYYTLMNGYKNTFLAGEDDDFADGTTFKMIYTCHWLDISLSNIILKYILLIEKSLKTKLSYVVSERFGVKEIEYLYFKNYANPNASRSGTITDIKKVLSKPKKNSVTAYYKNKKNHVPPWILVNDLMFGLTIQWYTILKGSEKEYICSDIFKHFNLILSTEDQKEFLKNGLIMVKDFRNKVAHGSRTLNLKLQKQLPMNSLFFMIEQDTLTKEEFNNGLGKNDLFSVMLIILILLNDNFQLNNFVTELDFLLTPYAERKTNFNGKNIYQLFNLPENIIDRMKSVNDLKRM
ncbi:Abi family protein [Enterococcus casseliflavus]|uniref:Abi family protein n=1 Tax=Enterococcus casseliflavus TaxID=37734 RepID=UPI0034D1B945